MSQVSIRDRVYVLQDDWLQSKVCLVEAVHSIVLAAGECSQDVGHMVDIQLLLMGKLVSTALHSLEDVLILPSLEDIQSLSNSGQLLWIGILCSFTQFMLIVSYHLSQLFFCIDLVHTIVLGPARCNSEEEIDEDFTALWCLNAVWE